MNIFSFYNILGMTDDVQTNCLEKFRDGYYKVIVCTSVGNEGIDIPDCNIVLSYEYSGDEITSIQLKGKQNVKYSQQFIFYFVKKRSVFY